MKLVEFTLATAAPQPMLFFLEHISMVTPHPNAPNTQTRIYTADGEYWNVEGKYEDIRNRIFREINHGS